MNRIIGTFGDFTSIYKSFTKAHGLLSWKIITKCLVARNFNIYKRSYKGSANIFPVFTFDYIYI